MTVEVALEHKALAQAAGQLFGGIFCIVGVIGIGLAGQQHVQGVVTVIIPLCVETLFEQAGLVMFIFHHQPHMARQIGLLAHPLGQFLE